MVRLFLSINNSVNYLTFSLYRFMPRLFIHKILHLLVGAEAKDILPPFVL